MDRLVVKVPNRVTLQFFDSFIAKTAIIFTFKGQHRPFFALDYRYVTEMDLAGVLLTYKLLEFAVSNHCFLNPNLQGTEYFMSQIKFYGFQELIVGIMNGEDIRKEYQNLRVKVSDDFFIAPIALQKGTQNSYTVDQINHIYYPQILDYYKDPDLCDMIFQVFVEMYTNFHAHSQDSGKAVMVAHGTRNSIEISCVDNGIGIPASLSSIISLRTDALYVKEAVASGVSSKKDELHMGFGLWYIDQVINWTGGRLDIISGRGYYQRLGKRIWSREINNWCGTIMYVRLPLSKIVLVGDLQKLDQSLKINIQ